MTEKPTNRVSVGDGKLSSGIRKGGVNPPPPPNQQRPAAPPPFKPAPPPPAPKRD
jgi:hypothetical protein